MLSKIASFVFAMTVWRAAFAWAESPSARTPVTVAEVQQAIAADYRQHPSAGSVPAADGVELPAAVEAAAGRSLRVATACWDALLARLEFRIECREQRQCMPFLAYVRRTSSGESENASKIYAACRPGSGAEKNLLSGSQHSIQPVIRSGQRATVVFLGTRLRLTSAVTCLERGSAGDVIRVRNQDGATFRARVAGPGLLEVLEQP
jgi:Chaperone for flagella basal body P-ring formation